MPSRANRSSPPPAGTSPYVALLRGVNVGGKNKLPMSDLAGLFAAAGCEAVRTYIQSGNVLFTPIPPPAPPADAPTDNTAMLHVAFLSDAPDPRRVAALDPRRSPGDAFTVRG